jgi:16S rRNA (cytidine1402-2'-O)-methyltransferase
MSVPCDRAGSSHPKRAPMTEHARPEDGPAAFGTLFLIPTPLHQEALDSIPPATLAVLDRLDCIIAERARTARRWIRALCPLKDIERVEVHELDKHAPETVDDAWLAPLLQGRHTGLMSEAGCPGIADPGARVVARAMALGIPVQALPGPSSLIQALMGSGLNGQSFAFHGYLPPQATALAAQLRRIEMEALRHGQTQIFIETPYRNESLLQTALLSLQPQTLLAVAANLGSPQAWHLTRSVADWRSAALPALHKIPAVFLIGTATKLNVLPSPALKKR